MVLSSVTPFFVKREGESLILQELSGACIHDPPSHLNQHFAFYVARYQEPSRVEVTRHDLPISEATKLRSHEGVTSHNLKTV